MKNNQACWAAKKVQFDVISEKGHDPMRNKDTTRITIQESALLVPSGKSKRLAGLRQQVESKAWEPVSEGVENRQAALLPQELTPEVSDALKEARGRIEWKIEQIKKYYPPGQQNKLFAIRYGDPGLLKRKRLRDIFALLNLETNLKNFKLIAHLNFEGREAVDKVGSLGKPGKKYER